MASAIAFYVISAFILGFAIMVITTKDTVHSVLFLVLDFLFVAALYVLLGAQFLAAIQILVYAGGIVVLYLFVVMLVNLQRPPEAHSDPHRRTKLGFGLAAAVLAELALLAFRSSGMPVRPIVEAAAVPVSGNTEVVGWMLYTSYLIPFEIASMLLLVAMIGAALALGWAPRLVARRRAGDIPVPARAHPSVPTLGKLRGPFHEVLVLDLREEQYSDRRSQCGRATSELISRRLWVLSHSVARQRLTLLCHAWHPHGAVAGHLYPSLRALSTPWLG